MFIILISVHFIVFIGIAVIQFNIYVLWSSSHLILSQQFFIPLISGQKSPQINIMELERTGIYRYFFRLLFFQFKFKKSP